MKRKYSGFLGVAVVLCLTSLTCFSQTIPNWAPNTAYVLGQVVTPSGGTNPLQYRCVVAGTSGAAEPFDGANDAPSSPATTISDGTCKWVCEPPVQAIQITVKYLDPTQNLLRQVTIVQSLLPP